MNKVTSHLNFRTFETEAVVDPGETFSVTPHFVHPGGAYKMCVGKMSVCICTSVVFVLQTSTSS